ncbi:hypothetical protein ACLKA6_008298 [Drosophila palustris]
MIPLKTDPIETLLKEAIRKSKIPKKIEPIDDILLETILKEITPKDNDNRQPVPKPLPIPKSEVSKEVQLPTPVSVTAPVQDIKPVELKTDINCNLKPTPSKKNTESINNVKPTGVKKTIYFKHKPMVLKKRIEIKPKPLVFKRNLDVDARPTSEEIREYFNKLSSGGEAVWPIGCQSSLSTSGKEPNPQIVDKTPPKKVEKMCDDQEQTYQDQVDEAVKSLLAWEANYKAPEKALPEEDLAFDSTAFDELESVEFSPEEECYFTEFLKSERIYHPLSEIKQYNSLLRLVRREDARKALHEKVKSIKIAQLRKKMRSKCAQPNPLTKKAEKLKEAKKIKNEQPAKKKTHETVKLTAAPIQSKSKPIAEVNKVQHLSIGSVIELPQKPQIKMPKIRIIHCGVDKPLFGAKSENKAEKTAILNAGNQPCLKQFGQTLTQVVRTKIHSLPIKTPDLSSRVSVNKKVEPMPIPVASQYPPIGSIISFPQPINYQKDIVNLQQLKMRGLPVKQLQFPIVKNTPTPIPTSTAAQIPQPQTLSLPIIKDPKIPENVKPQDKSRHTNEADSRNLAHLKRTVVMPALRRFADPRMKNILILRPPKVKGERAKLEIDVKYARTFSTMELNVKLDLNLLSVALDSAVYNSQVQVLMKRCDSAQVAWIWENGSILICNSRSQQTLMDTEKSLVAKILAVTRPPPNFTKLNPNRSHCHTINISNLPWRIDIEKFCQNYALTPQTILGLCRYGYYVNKNLPGIAAKIYESGMIHIISTTPAGVDKMLEKLYVLTADDTINVRILPNTIQPPPKPSFFAGYPPSMLPKRL